MLVVHAYLKLVRALATPAGMADALILRETGRLIVRLDPQAYDEVPLREVIEAADFVARHRRNRAVCKRLEGWIHEIPEHLHALKHELLQTSSTTVANFPNALLEFVRSAESKSVSVPDEINAVCDAIRRGETSIAIVEHAQLAGFYWSISKFDFPDLLVAKDAVRLLKANKVHLKVRALSDRATQRPSLKQGAKYVKAELIRAVGERFFAHGNTKSK